MTFVRYAVFGLFAVSVFLTLFGAVGLAVAVALPDGQASWLSGAGEAILFAPFAAAVFAVTFGFLEMVARRWPPPSERSS